MYAVFKRELFSLLNSLMAYITIGVFLLATGLLLWFFPDSSIPDYGYAELGSFFNLVPFLFIFLIPAISMRAFAEERREGTYMLLAIRPLTELQIILAKYLACLSLVVVALLPTLVYYFSVYKLGAPAGNIDSAVVAGSYVGLLLLGSAFVSVGILASSLAKNQVVAFALAAFICFLVYMGLDAAAKIFSMQWIEGLLNGLSVNEHYQSISRGVIDTRDLVYFFSFNVFFLAWTSFVLKGRKW